MAQNTRFLETYSNQDRINRMVDAINQMRKDTLLCDVILVTKESEIPSHKIILAASSPYFYEIFTNSEENHQKRITLNGISSQALSSILEFIYTSEVKIIDGNVLDILLGANLLQLTDLSDRCFQFLRNQLNSTNCLKIWNTVDLQDFKDFLKDVEDFILENFSDVVKSEDFVQLSLEQVSGIISKDELKMSSEEEVFESILTWIRHDVELRQGHFASLMKNVRTCYLPKEYIIETVLEEPLLKTDPQCIIDAFRGYASKEDSKAMIPPRKYQTSSKVLLVVGGFASPNTSEYYDFKEKRWHKFDDIPIKNGIDGGTLLNGKLYILGGGNEGIINIGVAHLSLTHLSMQFTRYQLGVATLKNCIYAVGGSIHGIYLDSVKKFDPETEQWSSVASMSTKRTYLGVGVIGDILYAVGGATFTSARNELNLVEAYNSTNDTWMYVKSMHFKRDGVGVGVLNGLLYAVGGFDGSNILKSVEVFNPEKGNWTMIKSMHNCRCGAAVIAVNNLLYVVGGSDGSKYLTSVEVYDPNTNIWSVLPSRTNIGRCSHFAVIIDKVN